MASLSLRVEWWCPLLLARLCECANGGGCGGNFTGPRPPIGAGLYTGLSSFSLDSSWRFGKDPIVPAVVAPRLFVWYLLTRDQASRSISLRSNHRHNHFSHLRVGHLNKKKEDFVKRTTWFFLHTNLISYVKILYICQVNYKKLYVLKNFAIQNI